MTKEEINARAYAAYPEEEGYDCDTETYYDYNEDKREGYIKALTEIESLPKIKGWVARGDDGLAFWDEKPMQIAGVFFVPGNSNYLVLDDNLMPEIKAVDKPVEVELLIRRIKE